MNRRVFMKSGAMALVTMGLEPDVPAPDRVRAGPAQGRGAERQRARQGADLLFQRGAADALNVVVPHGEQAYYTMRPSIADSAPGVAGAAADGDRPRRILRAASVARAVQAAVGRRHSRADARGGKSEQHALALRRAGLHGKRHARQQGHARRLAQSLSRGEGHVRRVQAASSGGSRRRRRSGPWR